MADRTAVTQVAQYAKETTEGTAVACTKKFSALDLMIGINVNTSPQKVAGNRRPTQAPPGKKWATVKGAGPLSYAELHVILAGVYLNVTPSTPGGGTNSRDWTFNQSSIAPHVVPTFTVEKGSAQGCERVAGAFFTGYTITGDPDKIDISVDGMGELPEVVTQPSTPEIQTVDLSGDADPTGGTWTLTILGQTITAIAWDVSAAALQALINALAVAGAADVTVTKAGFVYTITFPFYLGNVAEVTANGAGLTSGGSITITIATTQAGVAATEMEIRPVLPEHVNWYRDTSGAGVGTTQLLRVLSYSISDTDMRAAFWTVNRSNAGSHAGKAETEAPSGKLTLKVEADAAGMAFYTQLQAGDITFLRFEASDAADEIEAGFTYEIDLDFACRVESVSEFSVDQELYAIEFTLGIYHDPTWAKAMSGRVRNQATAL